MTDTPPKLPSFQQHNRERLSFSDVQRQIITSYATAAHQLGVEQGERKALYRLKDLIERLEGYEGMAGSMELFYQDMLNAGIINAKTPPMMMTEAILNVIKTAYELGCSNDPLEELTADNLRKKKE